MTYSIYSVMKYNTMSSENFNENLIQFDEIDDIVEELITNDKSYHFRIHPKTDYIFFGDLDHYTNNDISIFIKLLQQFLASHYDLHFEIDDFKYTKNNAKLGSFHYSIPKWHLATEKLKEMHLEFIKYNKNDITIKSNNRKITCVDTTIYSEHWFRCPNQSKGNSGDITKHIIICGEMKNFIVNYIPKSSINITSTTIKSIVKTNKKTNGNSNSKKLIILNKNELNQIQNTQQLNTTELLSSSVFRSNLYKQFFEHCYKQIRFDDYNSWIAIGMAIKRIFNNEKNENNEDIGLELFNFFSSKGNNYDGIEITTRKFNSFDTNREKGYSIATIYYYAMEDNKPKAIEIISKNTLQLAPTDICSFIKLLAGNKFFYRIENNNYELYCYNGKYWEHNDIILRAFISNELHEFLKYILVNVYWETVGREFQQYKSKIDKLKTISYKREIIETYKEYNARTDINFDDKWWLFGFTNLVYDMKECCFRDYMPEDYITITAGYDYIEPTKEDVEFIDKFISMIMPIEDERKTFLDILASGIDGRCVEKFIVFNGRGGNGKGVIDDLMLKMLGNYGILGNNSLLFEASKMGSNPEKANLHKKRYIIFREPPANKKFENSIIKELTGGGNFSARGHFESKTQKELNNTMICECNEKPLFKDKITDAEQRRLIDIYFRATFTMDESIINQEEQQETYIYRANPYYKTLEFQDKYKCALFKILTIYHKEYYHLQNSSIKMASSVIARTQQYLESCCDVVGWFKENYKLEENNIIRIGDIYNEFILSSNYLEMTKQNKENYTRLKFNNIIETNMFFRRYYKERHFFTRNIILGWIKINIDILE